MGVNIGRGKLVEERKNRLRSLDSSSGCSCPTEYEDLPEYSETSRCSILTNRVQEHNLQPKQLKEWGGQPKETILTHNQYILDITPHLTSSFPLPSKPLTFMLKINHQRPNFSRPIKLNMPSEMLSFMEDIEFSPYTPISSHSCESQKITTQLKFPRTESVNKKLQSATGQNMFMKLNAAPDQLVKNEKNKHAPKHQLEPISIKGNLKHLRTRPMISNLEIGLENFIIDEHLQQVWDLYIPSTIIYNETNHIRKVIHKETNELRILKAIPKTQSKEITQIEFTILKKINHPNIIRIFQHFQDKDFHYLILEYCGGGHLLERLMLTRTRYSEEVAANVTKQILSGIVYLHSKNIAHRDLKLENVLFLNKSKGSPIKIIDFGFASIIKNKAYEKVGTAYYIAPEVLRGCYNEKCDLWSLGVMLYMMLSNITPFGGANERQITQKIWKGHYDFPEEVFKFVSEAAKEFVRQLMDYNPRTRLSAIEALQNTWLITKSTAPCIKDKTQQAQKALIKLLSFHVENAIQRATLSYLISKLKENKELLLYKRLFEYLDLDMDGIISKTDIILAWKRYFPKEPEKARYNAKKILLQVDTNKHGFIDYHDFLVGTYELKELLTAENIMNAYDRFKDQKTNHITLESIKLVLGNKTKWSNLIGLTGIKEESKQNMSIGFLEYKTTMHNLLNPKTPSKPLFGQKKQRDSFTDVVQLMMDK